VNAAVFVTLLVHLIRTLNHEQVPFWFVTFYWSFDHVIVVVLEVPHLKEHCYIWLRIIELINNIIVDDFRGTERLTFQLDRGYAVYIYFILFGLGQCFSIAGPWHQLYRAARGSPGICHFSFLSDFHK